MPASFEDLIELMNKLRSPDGCPWDREQTHESLRKHLLEESYEAISAIDSGDFVDMREEFGDLLLQVVLQSQIANEEGQFNINQVIHGIHSKLVRRHPHVFGDLKLEGVEGVLANWEKLKEKEREEKKEKSETLAPHDLLSKSSAGGNEAEAHITWKDRIYLKPALRLRSGRMLNSYAASLAFSRVWDN